MSEVKNPYEEIDWNDFIQLKSANHIHMEEQEYVENAYDKGLDIFAGFDYNINLYPLEDNYPDLEQEILDHFTDIPNSEHRPYSTWHVTNIGSSYEYDSDEVIMGSPSRETLAEESKNNMTYGYCLLTHAHPFGHTDDIEDRFNGNADMYDQFPEHWRAIEIYNHGYDNLEPNLELWDELLKSGRQFWGCAVPDHAAKDGKWRGHQFVIVPKEYSKEDVVEAYQNGKFYSALLDIGLRYNKIEFNDDEEKLELELSEEVDEIRFISEDGVVKTVNNTNSATYERTTEDFIRVEAEKEPSEKEDYMNDYNEILFSQPLFFDDIIDNGNNEDPPEIGKHTGFLLNLSR